jgi:hypothetical protein
MEVLETTCDKCQVRKYCPVAGSAPLSHENKLYKCRIIGGYGKEPLDLKKASAESKELMSKNGPCLTLAEVPGTDRSSGYLFYKVVKIFSPPNLHPREKKVPWNVNMMYPSGFDPKK